MAGTFRFAHESFLFDPSASISASSFVSTLPPSFVWDQLPSKKWRSQGPWVVVAGFNDRIDLSEGGGALVATLTPGVYATPTAYALEVKTQLDVAGALTYTVTYPTDRFQINGTANFSLLWLSGANAERTAGYDLGFNLAADDTGTNIYAGDYLCYQGQHYLLLDIASGRVADLCVVLGHNMDDEGGFERRELILQGSIAGFPIISHEQELTGTGTGIRIAELLAAPSTPWSGCQEYRLVFRDISNPDGFSEAAVWFVGEMVETSVRPSIEYSRSRRELSQSVQAIDGAIHGDIRPMQHVHSLKWTDLDDAGLLILENVADETPPPTCFFMNFDSTDLEDTVYGHWADGGFEIPMAAAVYWNVSGTFLEALG